MSNMDKFLNYTTPSFTPDFRVKSMTLRDFFDVFREASDFGVKLLLITP